MVENKNSWPHVLLTSKDVNARRIYDKNWNDSSLGPIENWSQSFITILTTSMGSQFPALILWGEEFITFYNAGYGAVLGDKQNWALGKPLQQVWPEAWESLYGMLKGVIASGNGSWAEDQIYFLHRNGFPEESYFTFSFARIIDERGGFGGILCTAIETTQKVISERRISLLRDIANSAAAKTNAESVCKESLEVLKNIKSDIPFAMINMVALDKTRAELVGYIGMEEPEKYIDLSTPDVNNPFQKVFESGSSFTVENLNDFIVQPKTSPAELTVTCGLILPIKISTTSPVIGFLFVGLSPNLIFNDAYKIFLDLLVSQISAAVASAIVQAEAHKREKELAALDELKTAFFNNVSHEFRTPLTLLLGPLEYALDQSDGNTITLDKETFGAVYRNGLRLLKLVNTLLDFSRMEAGRLPVNFEPVDIVVFTKALVSQFRSMIEKAALTLEIYTDDITSPTYIEKDMWEKIVLNLLSNAYKFTFEGAITVQLKNYPNEVALWVQDTGIGISKKELPNLFTRFYRVEGAKSRSFEGSGIGLAMVQDMVKVHGGNITVESLEGAGTTIKITIPKLQAINTAYPIDMQQQLESGSFKAVAFLEEASRWNQTTTSDSVKDGIKPIILIVDDNADMRDYIARLLKPAYNIITANNGKDALRVMLTQLPNLIISDIMMPEMNGMELIKALRNQEKTRSLPIILLSARAGNEATIEGLEGGADDYLIKPFSAKELFARVKTQLKMVKLRSSLDLERRSLSARDEFLAIASHEINTPLTPLKIQLESLTRALENKNLVSFSPERLKIMVKVFHTQVNKISHLIRDLLDVTRISNGIMILNKHHTDLNEIIHRVLDDYSDQITQSKCSINLNLGKKVYGFWDESRIEQVIINLLTNALRYAGGKPINIVTTYNNNFAFLAFTDNGSGILKEDQHKIFERYERINADSSQGGLGLGLYICKQIIETHGGKINVKSEPGTGAIFLVELPMNLQNN